MNRDHFVASEAGKTVVVREGIDPELSRKVLIRSSFEDLKKYYQNRLVVTGVDINKRRKTQRLGQFWLDHHRRRQYKGIICSPGKEVQNFYNLWKGFSVNPVKGDWSLMNRHIEEIICAGNNEVYRYVSGWLAFAVQHPSDLPEVALVMRGKQGTGKGIFARGFGALFGQHFLHFTRSRNLVGNFNAHLRDAVVVFADEAFLADGDKEGEGVLKALITEPELVIEGKFKDAVRCRNLIHMIVASNNERIINAAAEERRFCVLDVSEARMQDHDYFKAILEQMKGNGLPAMLYDLQREDLSGFDPRKFPTTSGLQDQKIGSMKPIELWWFKKLQHGQLVNAHNGWITEVVKDDLLSDYHAGTGRHKDGKQDLVTALKKLLPSGYPENGARVSVDGDRKRTWVLPSLAECRVQFEKMFKMVDCWPEEE